MRCKHVLAALAAACCLCTPVQAADLNVFANLLEDLGHATRAADHARESFEDAFNGGRDYSRYERDWRDSESRLERDRVRAMARIAGVSEARIRSLRDDGRSWSDIARRYDVDPARFGYGISRYDHDRDQWKGVPPGLAKKGGLPPGQAKKLDKDHKKHSKK